MAHADLRRASRCTARAVPPRSALALAPRRREPHQAPVPRRPGARRRGARGDGRVWAEVGHPQPKDGSQGGSALGACARVRVSESLTRAYPRSLAAPAHCRSSGAAVAPLRSQWMAARDTTRRRRSIARLWCSVRAVGEASDRGRLYLLQAEALSCWHVAPSCVLCAAAPCTGARDFQHFILTGLRAIISVTVRRRQLPEHDCRAVGATRQGRRHGRTAAQAAARRRERRRC